ncbi:sigma-70 family RNA polymerase sigma factor [Oscillospiraceae bacterium 44-5]
MKYDFILTSEQQSLAEQHLSLVDKVIFRCIHVNETVCGLGREDLRQEGCLALCRAAATYDGVSAQFSTYAATLIRNHLLDCCKAAGARLKHLPAVSLDAGPPEEDRPPGFPEPSVEDGIDALIDRLDADALLSDCKRRYSGVARLGIEALELKIKGYSGADIARLYDAKPNHVGAWIARAAQKIRNEMGASVEKSVSDS